jgi:anion transporter
VDSFADTIRHIPFFSGLSREDLARIAGKLEEEKFSAAQTIVRQGESGDALYVVQSGAVDVVLEKDGVNVQSLAMLGPNESFGEMALFTGEKRSATVRAFVDSVILKLSKENWDELLSKHPSLSLHFCKVLSQRLAVTNRDISKGRGAFNLVMEEFFAAQPAQVQDFLIRTSILKTLEPEAIRSVLALDNPDDLLVSLSSNYPTFLQTDQQGRYEYRDYVRDFLANKLKQRLETRERSELHRRFASYFSSQGQWSSAIHHYLKAEAWNEALGLIEAHAEEMLEREPAEEILTLLEAIPGEVARSHGSIAQLKAEAYVRLGNLDAAIRSYQSFLGQKRLSTPEIIKTAKYYQRLAELHRQKGELGEAIGCLRLTTTMMEAGKWDLEAVDAMESIQALEQKGGAQERAFQWGDRAVSVARNLTRVPAFLKGKSNWTGAFLALVAGFGIWQISPPSPLDQQGIHFLATLAVAVILWVFEVFDQYAVALLLLLSWIPFGIAPASQALAGFSQSSWFFVLAVLGLGAAVTRSGLLYRVSLQVLRRLPPNYKIYTVALAASGLLATPVLPDPRARMAIIAPISLSLSDAIGFKPRSNGSAGLTLSGYIGFTLMSFLFLTGAPFTLIGWNLLPSAAKAEFGWVTWTLAALPAGMLMLFTLLLFVHTVFRPRAEDQLQVQSETVETQLEILGPLTRAEWLSVTILVLALIGWITEPIHRIGGAWVALAAFTIFLLTGVLDKNGLKNNIDWGLVLLVGVLLSLGSLMPALKVDRWLIGSLRPILSHVSSQPIFFLLVVGLVTYFVSLFLRRTPAVILLMLTLTSWAQAIGIHPGVLLLTITIAIDAWFFLYQFDSYQIAYFSTDERAFSHAQARKLMVAKFFASFLAIAVSVPYWRMLGFIR